MVEGFRHGRSELSQLPSPYGRPFHTEKMFTCTVLGLHVKQSSNTAFFNMLSLFNAGVEQNLKKIGMKNW